METSDNKRDGNHSDSTSTLLYAMCVVLFSTILFLYGFLPLKLNDDGIATMENVPTHVENVRVNKELLYKPLIRKLVIMVIDGLRWDFVAGPIGRSAMPVTQKLIKNNAACLLRAKVGCPTVTMPRIKAITTGSAPVFLDVVLNFGSQSISGDSLLLQAKNHGHKLIFHGDDTWIKLFPHIFHRSDGTTSFFVTDYTEVDNNVTRHLDKELRETDWTVMILHYLGLDHIGHMSGSRSPLIEPKLREMDEIISRINVAVERWQSQDEKTLFIICGDHGMRDAGGHGGNTPQETLVPFVAVGTSCPANSNEVFELSQVDISSTLAVLLGIPIPSSNLGSISGHMLNQLSTSRKLFSLYYNAKQVFNHFKRLGSFEATKAYEQYRNAIKLHSVWLEASQSTTDTVNEVINLYNNALRGMRDELMQSMTKYDLYVMNVATFFLLHALCIMIGTRRDNKSAYKKTFYFFTINVILLWVTVNHSWEDASESLLFANDVVGNLLFLLIVVILLGNCYFLTKFDLSINWIRKQFAKGEATQYIWLLGTLTHALSFVSSSFTEEEHNTWYFFWTTFCILLLYHIMKSAVTRSPETERVINDGNTRFTYGYYDHSNRERTSVQVLLCLLTHGLLRRLNSTGDKYAHLPDISDWLQQQESKIGMTLVLLSGLCLLVWIGYDNEKLEYRKYYLPLYSSLASCIYLRHMTNGAVARLPFYPISRGIYEVHIFWCLMLVFLLFSLLRLITAMNGNRRIVLSLLLRLILDVWVIVSAMLHRPYNVGLLPIQLSFSIIVYLALRGHARQDTIVQIQYWLGNVFYFYQGNSNSLSTLDVAAGYVGLESYNPYVTGIFLTINTYSAPVLAYLTLLYAVVSEKNERKSRDDVFEVNRRYAMFRLVPLTVCTIVVGIQRYHLFVWTVFSPKLLYESMYCAVMYFAIFTTNVISVIHDKINKY